MLFIEDSQKRKCCTKRSCFKTFWR